MYIIILVDIFYEGFFLKLWALTCGHVSTDVCPSIVLGYEKER